jgi:hypothetical protein
MSGQYWRAQSAEQLQQCFRFLTENFPAVGWRIEYKPWKDARTLSQNALSWIWYKEIADQISAKTGLGPFDDQDLHDRLLVERYGHEVVLVGTVEVLRVPRSSKFDKGKMHEFLQWVESWCSERNIRLSMPADSEYQKYKEAQIA